jgi:hypothetical protein
VYVQREAADFGIRGIVERDDFDGVAMALMYGGEAAHGFCGPATSGADGGDDVKESHDRRGKIAGPGGVVGWIVPAWKCDGVRVRNESEMKQWASRNGIPQWHHG